MPHLCSSVRQCAYGNWSAVPHRHGLAALQCRSKPLRRLDSSWASPPAIDCTPPCMRHTLAAMTCTALVDRSHESSSSRAVMCGCVREEAPGSSSTQTEMNTQVDRSSILHYRSQVNAGSARTTQSPDLLAAPWTCMQHLDIRTCRQALDLLLTMCTEASAPDTSSKLLKYLEIADSSLRDELVLKPAILAERGGPPS